MARRAAQLTELSPDQWPSGRALIEPYVKALFHIPLFAWKQWHENYGAVAAAHDDTSRANALHVHAVEMMKKIDQTTSGLTYKEVYRKQHLLLVDGGNTAIQFKKLSKALTTSNVPTRVQTALAAGQLGQLSIFSRTKLEHWITVGYTLNPTHTSFERLYIMERSGRRLAWHIEMDPDAKVVADVAFGEMFTGTTEGSGRSDVPRPQVTIKPKKKP